jgi:hypothetical protein
MFGYFYNVTFIFEHSLEVQEEGCFLHSPRATFSQLLKEVIQYLPANRPYGIGKVLAKKLTFSKVARDN